MRWSPVIVPVLLLSAIACSSKDDTTAPVTVALHTTDGSHSGHSGVGMRTGLTGSEEVPPRATPASGTATFRLSGDGETMSYELRVENIRNVVAAHIHNGPAGANGPIVVFLYGTVPPAGGAAPERLVSGQFTAAQFQGVLRGRSMDDLMSMIRRGQAYVNVHTNDGNAVANEGPGDFPGGEIRGQLGDK